MALAQAIEPLQEQMYYILNLKRPLPDLKKQMLRLFSQVRIWQIVLLYKQSLEKNSSSPAPSDTK